MKRRRLPHLEVTGQPLFVTFCLDESLPMNRRFLASNLTSGEAFGIMDRLLDNARTGNRFLARPEIADVVRESIQYGAAAGRYEMHAWVIMPNHVHLLLTPIMGASKLLGLLKGHTANKANIFLQRTGRFWQDESHDHVVRNETEFLRIRQYIENNPIKAGLCNIPEEYRWSSSWRADSPPQPDRLPHRF